MSSQGWFTFWEIVAASGTVTVIVGLWLEYDWRISISKFCRWLRGERDIPKYEVKIESPRERKGSVLVVLGIAIELVGGIGVLVQSDRIETQHRGEIAKLEAHTADLEIVMYGRPISDALKKAVTESCRNNAFNREILIGSPVSDDPSALLAGEIKSSLSSCPFKHVEDAIARQITSGAVQIGVVITGRPNDNLVVRLYSALTSTKELLVVLAPKPDAVDPVKIFVGARAFLPPSGMSPELLDLLSRHDITMQ